MTSDGGGHRKSLITVKNSHMLVFSCSDLHLENAALLYSAAAGPSGQLLNFLSLCRFSWTKNGQQFDPLLYPRLIKEGNSGTFVIPNKGNLTEYQGTYRCFASNRLGTAISREIEFIVPSK